MVWVVYAYSWRGLSRGEIVIELGQRSTESKLWLIEVTRVRKNQHHYPLGSSWISGWVLQANLYPWNKTGSLYNWSTFLCYCYFFWLIKVLYSCVFSFPKIISYGDLFKDKHGLGQKWLLILSIKSGLILWGPYLLTLLFILCIGMTVQSPEWKKSRNLYSCKSPGIFKILPYFNCLLFIPLVRKGFSSSGHGDTEHRTPTTGQMKWATVD